MQVKRMNWFQRPPLHEQMAAFRERQRAATENFQAATASASAIFASAQTDLFIGLAEITAQAVIERTNKQIQAQANSVNDGFSETTDLLNTIA